MAEGGVKLWLLIQGSRVDKLSPLNQGRFELEARAKRGVLNGIQEDTQLA